MSYVLRQQFFYDRDFHRRTLTCSSVIEHDTLEFSAFLSISYGARWNTGAYTLQLYTF